MDNPSTSKNIMKFFNKNDTQRVQNSTVMVLPEMTQN